VTVNGTPITESDLFQKLWQNGGSQVLDGMINDLLLRQEAASHKITVSQKDITDRFELMRYDQFRSTGSAGGKPPELDGALRDEIGRQLLVEKLLTAAAGLSVSESELKDAFEEHKEELEIPETVHLLAISVADEKQAEKLAGQIRGGADFSFLAKQYSLDPAAKENGGDWGFVAAPQLAPSMVQIVFLMKTGEVRAVAGPQGWYVMEVVDKRLPVVAVYADVKDRLRRILLDHKISLILTQYIAGLRAKARIVPQGP
jgi:parvulin-like peptidyl-prolyl isomerase